MSDCNHDPRVCLSHSSTAEYMCVLCGERWHSAHNGNVPDAPKRWAVMSLEELRVWYAKNVIKADLSGHGKGQG